MIPELSNIPKGLKFFPRALTYQEAEDCFHRLLVEVEWRQPVITFFSRPQPLPRLTAWYGDPGATYTYSGIENIAPNWGPDIIRTLRAVAEEMSGIKYNAVLLNQYRDGRDSVNWHADNEPGLSGNIASLSLGAIRRFQVREKPKGPIESIELSSGSLLIMPDDYQKTHLHSIPKTSRPVGPRINLTFRQVSA